MHLVDKKGFDPQCLEWESSSFRDSNDEHVAYQCFGDRLEELYDELESPTPRGVLDEWLHRKSGARYVMLATLIGVLFAVLLGMLSLAVSIFQAYIGYQAWKHPVGN